MNIILETQKRIDYVEEKKIERHAGKYTQQRKETDYKKEQKQKNNTF